MTWNCACNLNIWLAILLAILMVLLSTYCMRQGNIRGTTLLLVASLFAAAWVVGSLLEVATVDV